MGRGRKRISRVGRLPLRLQGAREDCQPTQGQPAPTAFELIQRQSHARTQAKHRNNAFPSSLCPRNLTLYTFNTPFIHLTSIAITTSPHDTAPAILLAQQYYTPASLEIHHHDKQGDRGAAFGRRVLTLRPWTHSTPPDTTSTSTPPYTSSCHVDDHHQ